MKLYDLHQNYAIYGVKYYFDKRVEIIQKAYNTRWRRRQTFNHLVNLFRSKEYHFKSNGFKVLMVISSESIPYDALGQIEEEVLMDCLERTEDSPFMFIGFQNYKTANELKALVGLMV